LDSVYGSWGRNGPVSEITRLITATPPEGRERTHMQQLLGAVSVRK
jgi:hypothetical protein